MCISIRHELMTDLIPSCQARILIVDDELINRHMVQKMLKRFGIVAIDCAEHGIEALARLRNQTYTAVLMDIEMPCLDGEETTRRLRTELKLEQLPVVAMTSHDSATDRDRCLQAGMNDYLSKPLNTKDLYRVLQRWLDLSATTATQDTAINPLLTIPGVDSVGALVRLDQNVALYHDMLRMFYQRNRNTAGQLTNLLATEQWQQARLLAHRLKGTAGHLGMCDLEAMATVVEHGIAKPPLPETAIADLITELARILGELATFSFVQTPNTEHTDSHIQYRIFSPQLIPQLQQLHRLLDEDMRAARVLMQQTAERIAHTTAVLNMQSIVAAIDDFDIDRAQHEIQHLVKKIDHADE